MRGLLSDSRAFEYRLHVRPMGRVEGAEIIAIERKCISSMAMMIDPYVHEPQRTLQPQSPAPSSERVTCPSALFRAGDRATFQAVQHFH